MAGSNRWIAAHCDEYIERQATRARERYNRRKENRLCVFCGKPLPSDETRITCPECREKQIAREHYARIRRYNRRKAEHCCTTCGRQLDKGDPNIECPECRESRCLRRREKRAMRRAEHEQSD